MSQLHGVILLLRWSKLMISDHNHEL